MIIYDLETHQVQSGRATLRYSDSPQPLRYSDSPQPLRQAGQISIEISFRNARTIPIREAPHTAVQEKENIIREAEFFWRSSREKPSGIFARF